MKALATFLLMISIVAPRLGPPSHLPEVHPKNPEARKGGQWYLAESGHAVYCYGPVMVITEPTVGFQRIATFCQGDKSMVPLRD
ncbi:MAG: hypothetical protein ACRD2U_08840 [Terriglobales bacterium]